MDRITLYPGD